MACRCSNFYLGKCDWTDSAGQEGCGTVVNMTTLNQLMELPHHQFPDHVSTSNELKQMQMRIQSSSWHRQVSKLLLTNFAAWKNEKHSDN